MEIDSILLGYFGPFVVPEYRLASFSYAVSPEYRHQGYGSRLLKLASQGLLLNDKSISTVEITIESQNIFSHKAALKAGFEETGSMFYQISRNKCLVKK